MGNQLIQIGAGGILALLIIREVLAFLKDYLKNRTAAPSHVHERSTDREDRNTQAELIAAMTVALNEALTNRVIPLLEEIKQAQRDDLEIIRERFHGVFNALSPMTILLELIKSKVS